ncbi:unnamed protein product [Cutaneotrichosporon oleaginosum]
MSAQTSQTNGVAPQRANPRAPAWHTSETAVDLFYEAQDLAREDPTMLALQSSTMTDPQNPHLYMEKRCEVLASRLHKISTILNNRQVIEAGTIEALAPSGVKLTKILGAGSFGTVFMTDTEAVVKVSHNISGVRHAFINEAFILKKLNGISQVPAVVFTKVAHSFLYLGVEAAEYGTIYDQQKSYQYTDVELLAVTSSLVNTLFDVHERNVVHLDIKGDNVVFRKPAKQNFQSYILNGREPSFIDWGAADVCETTIPNRTCGTPLRLAPEQLKKDGRLSKATDMWALAIVIIEMVEGKVFENVVKHGTHDELGLLKCPERASEYVARGLKRTWLQSPRWESDIGKILRTIVVECMFLDPASRPTAHQLAVYLEPTLAQVHAELITAEQQSLELEADDVGNAEANASIPTIPSHPSMLTVSPMTSLVSTTLGTPLTVVSKLDSFEATGSIMTIPSRVSSLGCQQNSIPVVLSTPAVASMPPASFTPAIASLPPASLTPAVASLPPASSTPAIPFTPAVTPIPAVPSNDEDVEYVFVQPSDGAEYLFAQPSKAEKELVLVQPEGKDELVSVKPAEIQDAPATKTGLNRKRLRTQIARACKATKRALASRLGNKRFGREPDVCG